MKFQRDKDGVIFTKDPNDLGHWFRIVGPNGEEDYVKWGMANIFVGQSSGHGYRQIDEDETT